MMFFTCCFLLLAMKLDHFKKWYSTPFGGFTTKNLRFDQQYVLKKIQTRLPAPKMFQNTDDDKEMICSEDDPDVCDFFNQVFIICDLSEFIGEKSISFKTFHKQVNKTFILNNSKK